MGDCYIELFNLKTKEIERFEEDENGVICIPDGFYGSVNQPPFTESQIQSCLGQHMLIAAASEDK